VDLILILLLLIIFLGLGLGLGSFEICDLEYIHFTLWGWHAVYGRGDGCGAAVRGARVAGAEVSEVCAGALTAPNCLCPRSGHAL